MNEIDKIENIWKNGHNLGLLKKKKKWKLKKLFTWKGLKNVQNWINWKTEKDWKNCKKLKNKQKSINIKKR